VISTAAFPRLNARLSQNRPDLFRKDFLMVLRAMIWISAPLAVICFFTRWLLGEVDLHKRQPRDRDYFWFLNTSHIL